MAWTKIEKQEAGESGGWGDGAWGSGPWGGGALGWTDIDKATDSWTKITKAEES